MDSHDLTLALREAGGEVVLDPTATRLGLRRGHARLVPDSLKRPLKDHYQKLLRAAIFRHAMLQLYERAVSCSEVVGQPDLVDEALAILQATDDAQLRSI